MESLKQELEIFYGKNQLESKDLSRIVNANHFDRLSKLLADDKVSDKIVHGGEKDKSKLYVKLYHWPIILFVHLLNVNC